MCQKLGPMGDGSVATFENGKRCWRATLPPWLIEATLFWTEDSNPTSGLGVHIRVAQKPLALPYVRLMPGGMQSAAFGFNHLCESILF